MWDSLGDHSPYDDLAITNDRMAKWAPLNQSLYVGYRVMLAGLLMISKGDRIAMHSSIEARYPFLDEDVIAVLLPDRPRVQAPRLQREVAAPAGRRPDPPQADRQPPQDDVPLQLLRDLPRQAPAPPGSTSS